MPLCLRYSAADYEKYVYQYNFPVPVTQKYYPEQNMENSCLIRLLFFIRKSKWTIIG